MPVIVTIKGKKKKNILEILLTHDRVNFEFKDKNVDGLSLVFTLAHRTGNMDLVKMLEERN